MFTLGYDKNRKCLVGVYKGMYSEEILAACASSAKSAMAKHPCKRFVMDMRQADLIASRINFNQWHKVFFEAGFDTSWKKAVLLSGENYQEVEDNQKLHDCDDMNLFGDIQEAIRWLLA